VIKFKRILFATDFSPASAHALDYAISLALEHEAKIVLIHVVEDIGFNAPFTLSSYPATVEYHHGMEEKIKEELQKVIAPQLKRQMQVEEVITKGTPFVEIIRAARDKEADLIVIPTHSHPGRKHSHLGPTAERVVSLSPCPVLVIRHPDFEYVKP
jgi:nucleotide-binding universal stress UspA family protein